MATMTHPSPEQAGPIRTALIGQRSIGAVGIVATLTQSRFALVLHVESIQDFKSAALYVRPSLCLYVARFAHLSQSAEQIAELRTSAPDLRILACSAQAQDHDAFMGAGANGHMGTDDSPESLLMALEALMRAPFANGMESSSVASAAMLSLNRPAVGSLSAREIEVAAAIADGQSNKGVARRLAIAEPTVKAHMRTILRKTGVANRTQLALWLSRQQLKPTSPPIGLPRVRPVTVDLRREG